VANALAHGRLLPLSPRPQHSNGASSARITDAQRRALFCWRWAPSRRPCTRLSYARLKNLWRPAPLAE
jgi:hypothetical protein